MIFFSTRYGLCHQLLHKYHLQQITNQNGICTEPCNLFLFHHMDIVCLIMTFSNSIPWVKVYEISKREKSLSTATDFLYFKCKQNIEHFFPKRNSVS